MNFIFTFDCSAQSRIPQGGWTWEIFSGSRIGGSDGGGQSFMIGGLARKLFRGIPWGSLHAGANLQSREKDAQFTIFSDLEFYLVSHQQHAVPFLLFGGAQQWSEGGNAIGFLRIGIGFDQKIGRQFSIPFRVYGEINPESEGGGESNAFISLGLCFR